MEKREREHEFSHECVFVSLGVAFVCGDWGCGEGFYLRFAKRRERVSAWKMARRKDEKKKKKTYNRPTEPIHHPFEIKMIACPVTERSTKVRRDGGAVGEEDREEVGEDWEGLRGKYVSMESEGEGGVLTSSSHFLDHTVSKQ